jgi:prepilin-type N-terminal cleavage/methylation domain-containing protein
MRKPLLSRKNHPCGGRRGFSLVELLITAAIAAAVITAAVLMYGAMTQNRDRIDAVAILDLPAQVLEDFYQLEDTLLQTWSAPSFGRRAVAEDLREVFLLDLADSIGVFVLSRATNATLRPLPGVLTVGPIPPTTPNDFRALLTVFDGQAETIFAPYTTAAPGPNASLFLIGPSPPGNLIVRAVYEFDQLGSTTEGGEIPGTYASVRRYAGGDLTAFYDVFFPQAPPEFGPWAAFSPVARFFPAVGNTRPPFYFIWWPDPAQTHIESEINLATFGVGDPRADYPNMGGRTAFFLVVPQFPSQP